MNFITYDVAKSQRNLKQCGLSFDRVAELDWSDAWIYQDERNNYGEVRYIVFGRLEERLHFVCFTETEQGIRVISFRKANPREVKLYEQQAHD